MASRASRLSKYAAKPKEEIVETQTGEATTALGEQLATYEPAEPYEPQALASDPKDLVADVGTVPVATDEATTAELATAEQGTYLGEGPEGPEFGTVGIEAARAQALEPAQQAFVPKAIDLTASEDVETFRDTALEDKSISTNAAINIVKNTDSIAKAFDTDVEIPGEGNVSLTAALVGEVGRGKADERQVAAAYSVAAMTALTEDAERILFNQEGKEIDGDTLWEENQEVRKRGQEVGAKKDAEVLRQQRSATDANYSYLNGQLSSIDRYAQQILHGRADIDAEGRAQQKGVQPEGDRRVREVAQRAVAFEMIQNGLAEVRQLSSGKFYLTFPENSSSVLAEDMRPLAEAVNPSLSGGSVVDTLSQQFGPMLEQFPVVKQALTQELVWNNQKGAHDVVDRRVGNRVVSLSHPVSHMPTGGYTTTGKFDAVKTKKGGQAVAPSEAAVSIMNTVALNTDMQAMQTYMQMLDVVLRAKGGALEPVPSGRDVEAEVIADMQDGFGVANLNITPPEYISNSHYANQLKMGDEAWKETYFDKHRSLRNDDSKNPVQKEIEARNTANKAINTKVTQALNRLAMVMSKDPEEASYMIRNISGSTKRVFDLAGDTDVTNDKGMTRQVRNFAERGQIQSKAHQLGSLRDTVRNVFFANGKPRRGEDALKKWQAFQKKDVKAADHIGQVLLFTKAFLELGNPTKGSWQFRGQSVDPAVEKMTTPDLIDYFLQNETEIMSQLTGLSSRVKQWDTNGLPAVPDATDKKILKRGHYGPAMGILRDVGPYMSGEPFTPEGRWELDQTNSNVALMGTKTGNIAHLNNVGIFVDPQTDTILNAEKGFYEALWRNMPGAAESAFDGKNDDEVRGAWKNMFNEMRDLDNQFKESNGDAGQKADIKSWGRSILIQGFYGIAPIAQHEGVFDAVLSTNSELLEKHLIGPGKPYKSIVDPQLEIDGAQMFEKVAADTMGSTDVVSMLKPLGEMAGMLNIPGFKLETSLGEGLQVAAQQTQPLYMSDVVDANGLAQANEGAVATTDSGLSIPLTKTVSDISYGKGEKNYSAGPLADANNRAPDSLGEGMKDKMSATMTQADDSAAEILAAILGVGDRGVGQPSWSTHDANMVNARSIVTHDLAYNHIAIPSIGQQAGYYRQVYEQVLDHFNELQETVFQSDQEFELSDRLGSQYAPVVAYFDRKQRDYDSLVDPDAAARNPFAQTQGRPWLESRKRKKQAKLKDLLDKAKAAGWNPPFGKGRDPDHKVTGKQIGRLIDLAFDTNRIDSGPFNVKQTLAKVENNHKRMIEIMKLGRSYFNSQT